MASLCATLDAAPSLIHLDAYRRDASFAGKANASLVCLHAHHLTPCSVLFLWLARQIEVAKLLIEHGAPCGCTDRAGWSSFHYAANHRWATWVGPIDGQLAVLELLATHGADINAGDGEGYTCVHSAAQSGKVAIVKLLRRLGARPDATTVRGVMPIHVAAEGGRAEVVDELLRWCPDVLEAEDCRGHRPIHHAAYHGHANVVEVLLRHGAKVCPGPSASSWERGQGTGQGTGQGGQGSQGRQQQGTTPLHLAVRSSKGTGALEVVMVLLAGGADPTLLDSHGWTPRALAAECARRRPGDVAVFLALDHVLKQAEVGVPLIWSRAGHHKYTPHFKSHAKDLLRAMSAPMHLHNVQGLVAEKIVDEVLRAAAKSAWPEVSVETWGSIERTRRAAEARWEAVSVCTHDGCGRLKLELGWYGAAGYQCVVAPAPAMGAGGVRGHSGSVHGRSGRVERERSVRARTAEKATNSNSDEGEEEVQSAPLSDHVHHAHFHQQLQHQQQFQHQQQLQYQQQQQLTMNFIMYQQQQQHIVNSAA